MEHSPQHGAISEHEINN